MTRKRVAGRFVCKGKGDGEGAPASKRARARAPHAKLMGRTQKQLMEAIPSIVNSLMEKAQTGSVPHMKLLLELCGLDKGKLAPQEPTKREKTLEEILTEQWRSEPMYGPGLK